MTSPIEQSQDECVLFVAQRLKERFQGTVFNLDQVAEAAVDAVEEYDAIWLAQVFDEAVKANETGLTTPPA